jgi:hypothetical protein
VAVRETGVMWANLLRAFQVGPIEDGERALRPLRASRTRLRRSGHRLDEGVLRRPRPVPGRRPMYCTVASAQPHQIVRGAGEGEDPAHFV